MTDRDLTLMNVVKTVFPECTNLLCRFLIDKNVKEKCKSLIGKKMHGSMSWMPGEVWLIVVQLLALCSFNISIMFLGFTIDFVISAIIVFSSLVNRPTYGCATNDLANS